MRPIRLFIAASLDGYIAGPNGELDWLFTDHDYGYEAFYAGIDTTLMGYKTYQTIQAFGGDFPYPDKANYVFSRQPWPDDPFVQFITSDPAAFVRDLQQQPGRAIWLVGGGQLNTLLLNAGLIDEIILSIHPIVLGRGMPLFAGGARMTQFGTTRSQLLERGLVQLTLTRMGG